MNYSTLNSYSQFEKIYFKNNDNFFFRLAIGWQANPGPTSGYLTNFQLFANQSWKRAIIAWDSNIGPTLALGWLYNHLPAISGGWLVCQRCQLWQTATNIGDHCQRWSNDGLLSKHEAWQYPFVKCSKWSRLVNLNDIHMAKISFHDILAQIMLVIWEHISSSNVPGRCTWSWCSFHAHQKDPGWLILLTHMFVQRLYYTVISHVDSLSVSDVHEQFRSFGYGKEFTSFLTDKPGTVGACDICQCPLLPIFGQHLQSTCMCSTAKVCLNMQFDWEGKSIRRF